MAPNNSALGATSRRAGAGRFGRGQWAITALTLAAAYVLSSGPVLAIACRLRETTGRDEFYAAFWLYAPLLYWGRLEPLDAYVSWWFRLFGAVGPG